MEMNHLLYNFTLIVAELGQLPHTQDVNGYR